MGTKKAAFTSYKPAEKFKNYLQFFINTIFSSTRQLNVGDYSICHGFILISMDLVDVKVLLFASAKEIAGQSEAKLSVKSKVSYEELKNIICEKFNLEAIKSNFILAINQDFFEEGIVELKNKDEIAVIPPLSGG